MLKRLVILLLCAACLAGESGAQPPKDPAAIGALLRRANQGDTHAQLELCQSYMNGFHGDKNVPEALRWCRRAAANGVTEARWILATTYFDGDGIDRDFQEASRWFGCPKPSVSILEQCRATRLEDVPGEGQALLRRMHCDASHVYDYGSAMTLSDGGEPAFEVCCHDAAHGPCDAVIIGKVSGEWKDLTPPEGVDGFSPACGGSVVLDAQHQNFHDICLPLRCAPGTGMGGRPCEVEVVQFENGRYAPRKLDRSTP